MNLHVASFSNCPCKKLSKCSWILETPWNRLSKKNQIRSQFIEFTQSKECSRGRNNERRIFCCDIPPKPTGVDFSHVPENRISSGLANNHHSATSKQAIVKVKNQHTIRKKKCTWKRTKNGIRCVKKFEIRKGNKASEENKLEDCKVKEVASASMKKCVFPFVYRGRVFNKCTVLDSGPRGTPWCSTKTLSATSKHISNKGLWGICPSKCKVDPLKTVAGSIDINNFEKVWIL